MAILSTGVLSRRGELADDGERKYYLSVQVISDNPNEDVGTVGPAHGILHFDPWPTDAAALCNRIVPNQEKDARRKWIVDYEYSSKVTPTDPNPLLRPWKKSWGSYKENVVMFRDVNGHGILNSAGQYFDPPVEVPKRFGVLTIERNEAVFAFATAEAYEDAVNTDGFYGYSAGKVKVESITAEEMEEDGFKYAAVTYTFHISRDGWLKVLLDQGRKEKKSGKLVAIMSRDDAGNKTEIEVSDPVPLDGTGLELANPTPTTVKFREFEVFKKLPFWPLGL